MRNLAEDDRRVTEFHAVFEDERLFRAWYDDTIPRLYGYLFHRVGGIRDVAEELTQETMVAAVRTHHRYDGRSEPSTWVLAIARHKLADHYRRLAREERRHLKLLEGHATDMSEDAAPAVERRDLVLRALRDLPPMQRAVLVLHYLDELPIDEIATELRRSESSVASLLGRARERVRRMLLAASEGEEDHDA